MPSPNIKTYYDEVSTVEADGREMVPAVTLPPLPSEHIPALERLIDWGKERKELTDLMTLAEASNADADDALNTITHKFPVKNSTKRVAVPQELVDLYAGGNPRDLKFGVQEIHSDEQWDNLERQVEWAKKYFPDIALYAMVDHKTGKKTALVMGIDAQVYNSLAQAQRKKEQLNAAVKVACKDLNVPEAWVDRKIEQTGATTKPQGRGQQQPPPPPPKKVTARSKR